MTKTKTISQYYRLCHLLSSRHSLDGSNNFTSCNTTSCINTTNSNDMITISNRNLTEATYQTTKQQQQWQWQQQQQELLNHKNVRKVCVFLIPVAFSRWPFTRCLENFKCKLLCIIYIVHIYIYVYIEDTGNHRHRHTHREKSAWHSSWRCHHHWNDRPNDHWLLCITPNLA